MKNDLSVEFRKIANEVKHKIHLFFLLDWIIAYYHHYPIVDLIGNDRVDQLCEELLDNSRVRVASIIQHFIKCLALFHFREFLNDLLFFFN